MGGRGWGWGTQRGTQSKTQHDTGCGRGHVGSVPPHLPVLPMWTQQPWASDAGWTVGSGRAHTATRTRAQARSAPIGTPWARRAHPLANQRVLASRTQQHCAVRGAFRARVPCTAWQGTRCTADDATVQPSRAWGTHPNAHWAVPSRLALRTQPLGGTRPTRVSCVTQARAGTFHWLPRGAESAPWTQGGQSAHKPWVVVVQGVRHEPQREGICAQRSTAQHSIAQHSIA